ncbi:phosphonoacetaldehyde hydrolase [bacterium]|nr:phosphonoacetaldehyde hydrolase [bacterium]
MNPLNRPRQLQALVLDWAGTMVDHGCCGPALVFREIFRGRGIDITMAQAREPMGRAKRDHIAAITHMPEVAAAWQVRYGRPCSSEDIDAMYHDFLPLQKSVLAKHSDVIPGTAEAVAQCREMGLKIGSSTGYTQELMEVVVPIARQQGYSPDCVLCVEDAPRGRPYPYLLFEAAKQMEVFPLWTIVKVDDTPVGIEAGRNAGCWTVGITRTGNCVGLSAQEVAALPPLERAALMEQAADRLRQAGAHVIIESVAEIVPVLHQFNARLAQGELPDALPM